MGYLSIQTSRNLLQMRSSEIFKKLHLLLREEPMDGIDLRIAIVLAPLALAAGWAIFNIGAAALNQVQVFLTKAK